MKRAKGIFFAIIIINIFNFVSAGLVAGAPTAVVEQRILEEILALDTRVLALQKELEKLSLQKQQIQKELEAKQKELSYLNLDFDLQQQQLSRWVIFCYKGGIGNMISALMSSEDLGDFFRRFDNIIFFMEYYNNVITKTKALISQRKQEEKIIMEKQREIQSLEEQTRTALEKITKTIEDKQKELMRARLVLKDTAFLEEISENWQESLPSLDYLLKNLSSLPWTSLKPDNLRVNYFAMSARAEFFDTSVTKTLLSNDENLKNVFITFDEEGITVTEANPNSNIPVYSITFSMSLTKDHKIEFTPIKLEFSGVTLPTKIIDELMTDYNMTFTPPPLPYNLKITSIDTQDGKLIMNFKK